MMEGPASRNRGALGPLLVLIEGVANGNFMPTRSTHGYRALHALVGSGLQDSHAARWQPPSRHFGRGEAGKWRAPAPATTIPGMWKLALAEQIEATESGAPALDLGQERGGRFPLPPRAVERRARRAEARRAGAVARRDERGSRRSSTAPARRRLQGFCADVAAAFDATAKAPLEVRDVDAFRRGLQRMWDFARRRRERHGGSGRGWSRATGCSRGASCSRGSRSRTCASATRSRRATRSTRSPRWPRRAALSCASACSRPTIEVGRARAHAARARASERTAVGLGANGRAPRCAGPQRTFDTSK